MGWLLPTLLLLEPSKEAPAARLAPTPAGGPQVPPVADACTTPAADRWSGTAAAAALALPNFAATWAEAGLRGLLGGRRQQALPSREALPASVPLALRWVVCLQVVWLACCAVAPLPLAR